jgi:hypothetical protein
MGDTQNKVYSASRLRGLRPFKPGQSGNPSGRPRGLGRYIRARTDDGERLADFVLGIFEDTKQDIKLRLEAASWLADRGIGKPVATLEMSGPDGTPIPMKSYAVVSPDDWPGE